MSTDDETIAYDYSQCEIIYEDLLQDQATIVAQIGSLENTINNLRTTWTGLSFDQWQSIQNQWMAEITSMSTDLKNATNALPEMADAMKRADNAAADRIASIGQS